MLDNTRVLSDASGFEPDRLIADNGYSYPRCRQLLQGQHIPHTIPERSDQQARRADRPGRLQAFDKTVYA